MTDQLKHIHIAHDMDVLLNVGSGLPELPPNGVLLYYGRDVAFTDEVFSPRGRPRVDYERVYNVIPQDATEARAVEIFLEGWRTGKQTAGGSFDDAGVGDLTNRQAVLWDIPATQQHTLKTWFIANYPGVWVRFR